MEYKLQEVFDLTWENRKLRIDLITGNTDNPFVKVMDWLDYLLRSSVIRKTDNYAIDETVFFKGDQWLIKTDHFSVPDKIIVWLQWHHFYDLLREFFDVLYIQKYCDHFTEMLLSILIEKYSDDPLYQIFTLPIEVRNCNNLLYKLKD